MKYKTQKQCRVCSNTNLIRVVELGDHYLSGVFPSGDDKNISKGPLNLVKCHGDKSCGLVQLEHTYDHLEMYGDNYGYRSGLNSSMVNHLNDKVNKIENLVDLNDGDVVLDIGSNDATTLKLYSNQNLNLIGIDPTAHKFSEMYTRNITLVDDFFDQDIFFSNCEKKAKVITSISMFYDLPDPIKFTQDISSVLDDEGIWVLEQSYLLEMLRTNSYDTICHEHLEYYSIHDIKNIADQCNLKIIDIEFNSINGGSFSLSIAKKESQYKEFKNLNTLLQDEIDFGINDLSIFESFQKRIDLTKRNLLETLNDFKNKGISVAGIGASTKGNVLLQYCNINKELISCIGEVNREKYGKFTPGTKIPIVPQEQVINENYNYFLILPWHFKDFFKTSKIFSGKTLIFALPEIEIIKID